MPSRTKGTSHGHGNRQFAPLDESLLGGCQFRIALTSADTAGQLEMLEGRVEAADGTLSTFIRMSTRPCKCRKASMSFGSTV